MAEGVNADAALRSACVAPVGQGASQRKEIRPARVNQLDRLLFGADPAGAAVSDAMRGLLLALGMARQAADGASPQPVRGHFFFHNVQNMWACANPQCQVAWHREQRAPVGNGGKLDGPVGALHAEHRISCSCGGRVLDLIVCEVCGDVLLGGYRSQAKDWSREKDQPAEILIADRPDVTDQPNRMLGEQQYGEYAVFWAGRGGRCRHRTGGYRVYAPGNSPPLEPGETWRNFRSAFPQRCPTETGRNSGLDLSHRRQ